MINLFNSPSTNNHSKKWTQQQAFWFLLVLFSVTLYAVIGNTLFAEGSLFQGMEWECT